MQADPSIETTRLAPACVCNVASRVLWLRAAVKKHPELQAVSHLLKPYIDPLPFEAALLSGNYERVQEAIRGIGELYTS